MSALSEKSAARVFKIPDFTEISLKYYMIVAPYIESDYCGNTLRNFFICTSKFKV